MIFVIIGVFTFLGKSY